LFVCLLIVVCSGFCVCRCMKCVSCERRLRSYGVMVSTLDSESSDPGSNPGRTSLLPKTQNARAASNKEQRTNTSCLPSHSAPRSLVRLHYTKRLLARRPSVATINYRIASLLRRWCRRTDPPKRTPRSGIELVEPSCARRAVG
jgi:hypothetical protein